MRTNLFLKAGALALTTALFLTDCTKNDTAVRSTASVALVDSTGRSVGTALLTENEAGIVTVLVDVTGLPAGEHGIHFHEVGVADPNARPPFSTSGAHYNPTGRQHGLDNPAGPHAGDLPNLLVNASGTGSLRYTTNRISLSDGPATLFDANGTSLLLHANRDDQRTDPDGNSGARIAGGVVVRD